MTDSFPNNLSDSCALTAATATATKICLMSCCAPCSAGAILELADAHADFCVLFFNPNIYPFSEYQKRLVEQIKYCKKLGVKYAVLEYDHDAWLGAVRGLEDEPERGRRCSACFMFRFRRGAEWARANGYTHIASVFGVSRHKSQTQVDTAAENATKDFDIIYMPVKWDEQLRQKIGHDNTFYRQNYCGCEYSNGRLLASRAVSASNES